MTIGYTTKWPKSMGKEYAGKPNHFVEKIWQSFPDEFTADVFTEYLDGMDELYDFDIDANLMRPKRHTMRNDAKDRWKVGMKIHPVILNRTKDRFQFAPILEVKGIQKIDIANPYPNNDDYMGNVWVDNRKLNSIELDELILNDGFPSVEAFFRWFNKDWSGKIIHWTDLKY
ncbi:hypothetical protein INR75_06735 [Zunongwangia sp. SCSIO 43204]|uniref:hypothetical protein n=1 Tax=Zunongwangia sp. SCSIO 43204 TaxID=2779359 RepID=UPI001CAA0154|nr:hypothetical protein [Zunongwangia sp. SCSIO 43204]UAB85703.1 hypothetical protein INR75_06735 [Zunongwangia sp. SCSIO 43204]